MLQIRRSQMEAFSKQMEDAFVKRMVRHLRADFPEELTAHDLQETDLDRFARRGVNDARGYGVVNEKDVQLYIECMVLLCPDFDRSDRFPWAGETLKREDLDGEQKMDQINEHLAFGLGEPL